MDYVSCVGRCIQNDKKTFKECLQVLKMGIEHLVTKNSAMNQLAIQTIFVPLFSHPKGKILDEAFLLIKDPLDDTSLQSTVYVKF